MQQFLRETDNEVPGGVALMLEHTIEKPYGWVFFYNSKRFLESGDPFESLVGNSPVLVEAADGRMTHLGTAWSVEDSLRKLEIERGLASSE